MGEIGGAVHGNIVRDVFVMCWLDLSMLILDCFISMCMADYLFCCPANDMVFMTLRICIYSDFRTC